MQDSIHTEGEGGIKALALKFDIDCTFVEVESYKEVFELLSNNKVDAGIVNRIFGSLFSKEYDVRKTSMIFNPSQLKFAFPKDSSITPSRKSAIETSGLCCEDRTTALTETGLLFS